MKPKKPADEIREIRERLQLSKSKFAKAIGEKVSVINKIENNRGEIAEDNYVLYEARKLERRIANARNTTTKNP